MATKTDTIDKLKELKCDPIELSAKIAMGEEYTFEHPNFNKIQNMWINIKKQIRKREISMRSLNEFWFAVEEALCEAPPTIEMRSKHIIELMQHVSAKKKAIENTNIEKFHGRLDELDDETLEKVLAGESDLDLSELYDDDDSD